MVFKKTKNEVNGNQNFGYIDDELKFPKVINSVKSDSENEKTEDKKEPAEEKDKSSFFALVGYLVYVIFHLTISYKLLQSYKKYKRLQN